MKTRQPDRDVPGPGAPWNEIAPRLWMGGHYWSGPDGLELAVVEYQFDTVISLVDIPGHGPAPGVEHHCAPVPDGPLNAAQLAAVLALCDTAVAAHRAGRTTLVRCHSGYNRSGLVVAQTLISLGRPADQAIALIRSRRSPWALHNDLFVDYLTTGLETAQLLTSLGAPEI
ncbi:dual specificity protein phosphatase family protein [Kitasatospora paracochleata]|uniref:Tyrosine specific protein phosphatases domain-containing protein n=1 Tax=Kitasatospora paracochleata TaxID=58354 RepID=A0ABT1J755_9ACTN|nr:protein phosphatase [Kitasatospora paracochleata]MCP2313270.1 hypothetical protein [Kitasatospora paracochleata]